MLYLSKGIVQNPSTEHILYVSRCGSDFTLTGVLARIWLDGRLAIGKTADVQQEAKLRQLTRMGLAESEETDELSAYRILTNCVICPAKLRFFHKPLNRRERDLWQWISRAGLRLTAGELVSLEERGILPVASLLGKENRQKLTELIYTTETIFDGILETRMEHSPACNNVVKGILGLLRKKRILLI